MSSALLELREVVKLYPVRGPGRKGVSIRAVDGVDLAIPAGRVFGLVGESGSGKTTVARCILGLTPLSEGSIEFGGVDLSAADRRVRRALRREIQLVFQQPAAALDPRMTVDRLIAEPLTTHGLARGAALHERVARLVDDVGLLQAHLRRYPHELSGGQCQRVVIARALATDPRLVILDEPTSALDIVVQAQILNLLVELRDRHGLTYLLISHDLSVVRHLSDRIGVMYLGRVVEEGPAAALLDGSPPPVHAGAAREHARPWERVPRRAGRPRGRAAVDLGRFPAAAASIPGARSARSSAGPPHARRSTRRGSWWRRITQPPAILPVGPTSFPKGSAGDQGGEDGCPQSRNGGGSRPHARIAARPGPSRNGRVRGRRGR